MISSRGVAHRDSEGAELIRHLWRKRRIVSLTCAVAVVVAGLVSILLPADYTATASLMVEPPGGNDPRASTALSTVYLESLKTYERLASSDTLFEHALTDLKLRANYAGTSIESLKKKMLRVSKPASTTIIDISVTLNNPRDAQALAQYIAEHTVALNSSLAEQTERELLAEPQRIVDEARARVATAERAKDEFVKSTPIGALDTEIQTAADLRSEVGKNLAKARTDLAHYTAQQEAPRPEGFGEQQLGWTQYEIASTRARIQDLEAQDKKLLDLLNAKSPIVEQLKTINNSIETEVKAARADRDAGLLRLNDVKTSAPSRGARLRIIDPGIVPQRPSSPNIPLNVMVAFVLSLTASIGYFALQSAYQRSHVACEESIYQIPQDALR